MGLTGAQLRALAAGHARVEAGEAARAMAAVRTAVWADGEGFAAALDRLAGEPGGPDDRSAWLMGWEDGP